MVFVTVGNATQPFPRLLEAVQRLTVKGVLNGVVIQAGHTFFKSDVCEVAPFFPADAFERFLAEADLVIAHGGCTQLHVVRLGRKPVVMPRRRRYGEHVNDHQLQLVEALAAEGYIQPAFEAADLEVAIAEVRRSPAVSVPPSSPMVELVKDAVARLSENARVLR